MKRLRILTAVSILALMLAVGCNVQPSTEAEATATETEVAEPVANTPAANDTAAPLPTRPSETAVPLPTAEVSQTVRLTPAATPNVEVVPSMAASTVIGEVPDETMTAIFEDLTATQNVAQEGITVNRAEAVIWNDGSLGCPQPDEFYTQATVPGYWIVLEANGRTYDYHIAENGYFILCQTSQPPLPPAAGTPIS